MYGKIDRKKLKVLLEICQFKLSIAIYLEPVLIEIQNEKSINKCFVYEKYLL